MSTTISILGGVGLFLLGMTVMTEGLKALAGSSLRTVLSKAAATPLSGAFRGAVVTLLVQSSSATTMTTIGLVSAGLLTFPQGLGLKPPALPGIITCASDASFSLHVHRFGREASPR